MMWKRLILFATVVIGLVLTVMSVVPEKVDVGFFDREVNFKFAASSKMPVPSMVINGLALSGYWEGPGFAQVFLVVDGRKYLVMDTRELPEVIEFAGYGARFESMCKDSCRFSPGRPEEMFTIVSGPGMLSIDGYHYSVPLEPTGLAFCPNCKTVKQPATPDHALLVPVILLVLAVLGGHVMGHCCRRPELKKTAVIVFFSAFVVLSGVFGVAVAAPTTALAVTAKQAASVLAAFGVVVLIGIVAFEVLVREREKKKVVPDAEIWREVKEAEDRWEK